MFMKTAGFMALLTVFMLTSGCSGLSYIRFQQFDDEFKNSRKLIGRITLRPVERRSEINSAYVVFEREISSDNDETTVWFVVSRSTKSFRIEDRGYLKAGDKTFETDITNIFSEYKSKSSATFQTFAGSDSTGASSGVLADVDERIWIDDKFRLIITPEMTSEIRKAGEFIARFYFGPVPATFRFIGSKFKPVRKLFAE